MIDYKEKIREFGEIDMSNPDLPTLDNLLIQLSVALSEVGDKKTKARSKYYQVLRAFRKTQPSVAGAEVEANASPEYEQKEQMEADYDTIKNVINVIKHLENQYNELYRKGI